MSDSPTLGGSPLERASSRRHDEAWLDAQRRDERARFLPLWRRDPLRKADADGGLAWARWVLFEDLDPTPEPVLLGHGDGVPHFAVDVSQLEKPLAELGLEGAAEFADLRAVAAQLSAAETGIAAQARAMVDWHARHGHCPGCGGRTRSVFGGSQRNCIECGVEHFPRTDPVVIAVVTRGDRCLLGRGNGWPEKLFSALAGYVEPGETLEDAVRREVAEEAGVKVGAVRYLASQPWPFPASLMVGFLAGGESEAITLQDAELADARWFERSELRAALAGKALDFAVPPAFSIAHHLIRAWVDSE